MARRTILWLVIVVVVGGGACKARDAAVSPVGASTGAAAAPSSEPPSAHPTEWVAVFEVDEVDRLDDETRELMRVAGERVAIAPIGCWEGLSQALGDPKGEAVYVAAVVATSEHELEQVVARVGRETLFEGELTAMCTD